MKDSDKSSLCDEKKEMAKELDIWSIVGKRFAMATVGVIIFFILFLAQWFIFPSKLSGAIILLHRISLVAIVICPMVGLCFSIAGKIKTRINSNISSKYANEALRYNLFFVISILFVIILVPNFLNARASGQLANCQSNINNLVTSLEMYATDNKGIYPSNLEKLLEPSKAGEGYVKIMPQCLNKKESFMGKIFLVKTTSYYIYTVSENHQNFTLSCGGKHDNGGLKDGFPQFNTREGLILK